MSFIIFLFGRNFQDYRVDFLSVGDQALHILLTCFLSDQDHGNVGISQESFEHGFDLLFGGF